MYLEDTTFPLEVWNVTKYRYIVFPYKNKLYIFVLSELRTEDETSTYHGDVNQAILFDQSTNEFPNVTFKRWRSLRAWSIPRKKYSLSEILICPYGKTKTEGTLWHWALEGVENKYFHKVALLVLPSAMKM